MIKICRCTVLVLRKEQVSPFKPSMAGGAVLPTVLRSEEQMNLWVVSATAERRQREVGPRSRGCWVSGVGGVRHGFPDGELAALFGRKGQHRPTNPCRKKNYAYRD